MRDREGRGVRQSRSQCDNANPNGPGSGTAFFGGPESSGPLQGLQAEFARVPFANVGLVKLPDEVPDDAAILLSDIFRVKVELVPAAKPPAGRWRLIRTEDRSGSPGPRNRNTRGAPSRLHAPRMLATRSGHTP